MGLWLYGRAKRSTTEPHEPAFASYAPNTTRLIRALPKPPAAQCLTRFSNGFQLCMGKGVFARFPAVTPPADDAARTGDNSAYGHFPLQRGKAGEKHCFPHAILIRHSSIRPPFTSGGGRRPFAG